MALQKAFIPYRGYFSSPFCRWQGSLSGVHSLELVSRVGKKFLADRKIPTDAIESLILGYSVPQPHCFYGAPWVAGMMGLEGIGGATIGQACATSARVIASAALEVEMGQRAAVFGVTCDRTSNGPHIYYPNPGGTGGMGEAENPVWDNFNKDPFAGQAMIQTAENVTKQEGITRQEQDELTLLRSRQYEDALKDDRAFHRRFMAAVEIPKGKKKTITIEGDEGVFATTADGLARLRPVLEAGTVTFGTQTFPADGNAGLLVCSRDHADKWSHDAKVTIQVLGYGEARVAKGFMPTATVPAAKEALGHAGISISDCKAIKTHNPFAANDVYFCRKMEVKPEAMNRYGSPLVWGHPQGPTGMRAVIELIEELAIMGGGHGLFAGCAAGDTAMALVLKVG